MNSSHGPNPFRMHVTSSAVEEEELFQIQQAATAFVVPAVPAIPVLRQATLPVMQDPLHMPVVRQATLPVMQNPLHLQLAASKASALLASAAMQPPTRSSEHSVVYSLLKKSSSSASVPVRGGLTKKKSARKRGSGGVLVKDPFTLVRPSNSSGGDATSTKKAGVGKSLTPTGSSSGLSRSFSGGKHRYSDSYLSAGLHGRSGTIRHIAGDKNATKNATWGQQTKQALPSQVSSGTKVIGSIGASTTTSGSVSPLKFLKKTLEARGIDATVRPSLDAAGFFLENSEEHMSSYAHDVVTAVRSQDIPALRRLRSEGRTLQCCNRFGESLIHMACRRGFMDVVRYLLRPGLEGGDVSVLVRDDYGRTPLHDACWSPEPNFELMELLLDWCETNKAAASGDSSSSGGAERLLLMSDKRGHTPLDYARMEHWDRWIEFLGRRFGEKAHVLSTGASSLEQ